MSMDNSRPHRGASFYDEPGLLAEYLAHRHAQVTSPNPVMEAPAFAEVAGDLAGLRVLELGCGDGTFAAACVGAGCASYVGVDGSAAMIRLAEEHVKRSGDEAGPPCRFELCDLENFLPPTDGGQFDLVVSRMTLHYVNDLDPVFVRAHQAMAVKGRLILTVVHPVVTANDHARSDQAQGPRTSQVVDDYFVAGDRVREWFGSTVVWQHRTIEQYVRALEAAGFELDTLRECEPQPALFAGDASELERRRRVPVFLLLAARPGASVERD
jgi:SAM-dependent methyltransferase